jgi:glycosyltransferase involved in cell wall biosynthesis
MRIIHLLAGKADPNTMNGVNKVVHHLASETLQLGVDVEVWGITKTPNIVRHHHDYKLRLFSNFPLRYFPTRNFSDAIESMPVRETIVHMHSVFLPELYGAARLLKSRGIGWLVTPHGGYDPRAMSRNTLLKRAHWMFFDRAVLTSARVIHALSPREGQFLQQLMPDKSILCEPNGQSLSDLDSDLLATSPSASNPVFGYCGRLDVVHKGLDLLFCGFKSYVDRGGQGELQIIGDGVHRKKLHDMASQLGLSERIIFFGQLSGPEKVRRLQGFDVFVHTSRWEGLPTAVLEAAGLGIPLLVSSETNTGFFVEGARAGIVLPSNTPDNIGLALEELERRYQNNELRVLGDNGRRTIAQTYTWNAVAQRMIDNVYSLCFEKSATP